MGSLVSFVAYPYIALMFDPHPYSKVKVYNEVWDNTGVEISASFIKNGHCKLLNFSVVSFSGGLPRYVPYKDLDNLSANFDREAGEQGLNLYAYVDPVTIDYLEIRTRHLCTDDEGEQETITEVFSRHEPR